MKSICENGKGKLDMSLTQSYIYLSTTNTVLHGKTSLHIKVFPYKQGAVLP